MPKTTLASLEPGAVATKEDLVSFIADLSSTLRTDNEAWENPTLDRFLDALSAWLGSSDQLARNMGHSPHGDASWDFVAKALFAASIYE